MRAFATDLILTLIFWAWAIPVAQWAAHADGLVLIGMGFFLMSITRQVIGMEFFND